MGVDRQVEVGGAEVEQVTGLAPDRADDVLVAVAGRVDRDAGREVEEEVAVDVLHHEAVAAHGHDGVGTRQAGRSDALVEGDVRAGLGTRQLGHDVGDRAGLAAAVDELGHVVAPGGYEGGRHRTFAGAAECIVLMQTG